MDVGITRHVPMKPVTVRRWEVVAAFILLAAAFTFGLWKVQHDSASIAQLQRTNCSLKQFLVTAEQARAYAGKRETGLRRRQDLQAAHGYAELAARFQSGAIGRCHVPLVNIPPG